MKKLSLFLAAISAICIVQASELYWLVGDGVTVDGKSATWETAKLYASADGSNFGGTTPISEWTMSDMSDWGYAFSDVDPSMQSFYVELYTGAELIGSSYVALASSGKAQGAVPYSSLEGNMRKAGGMSTAEPSPYTFSQFTTSKVVPEPTSGLLMLIGLAGLALKRKRA